jgi:hypothetical protein
VIDLNKDKSEFAGEIVKRKEKAALFINEVYDNYESETINQYVSSIECLTVVKEKIEQFKLILQ